LTNSTLNQYQKNGTVMTGSNLVTNVVSNTITGAGPTSLIAQNGVQISGGATGTVSGNTISGHSYTPFTTVSVGLLLLGDVNTNNNTLSQNQVGIFQIDGNGRHTYNNFNATGAGTGSPGFWGLIWDAPAQNRQPNPFDVTTTGGHINTPLSTYNVELNRNTFTSNDSTGGVGAEVDAGFGGDANNVNFTASNNSFTDLEYGLVIYKGTDPGNFTNAKVCCNSFTSNRIGVAVDGGTIGVPVKVNYNNFQGNTDFGLQNTSTNTVDGTNNWWGSTSGPAGAGGGSGDAVSTGVTYSPFASAQAVQDVNWINAVNVTVSSNSIEKTSGGLSWNAGAISSQSIQSGDGYVQMTAGQVSTNNLMFGLGNTDTNQSYTDIEFAFYVYQDGSLYVYESGISQGLVGTYAEGDQLKVAIQGGQIKYYKNTTLLYTSSGSPTYPLYMDSSLYYMNSRINDAIICGTGSGAAVPTATSTPSTASPTPIGGGCQPVIWTNSVNVSVSGNTITKNAGGLGWNAGAVSSQALQFGDGYVQMTATSGNNLMFGLGNTDTNQSYTDIEFAFYVYQDGSLYVFESGTNKGLVGRYTTGDALKVAIESGQIKYYKNGTLLYTSSGSPVYPMSMDTSIYYEGSSISNAIICGDFGNAPTPTAVGSTTPTSTSTPIPGGCEPVLWTDGVNVNVSGNTITKNAGGLGWNAGAVSSQALQSGDGYVQMTATSGSNLMFGLGNTDTNQSYNDIEFALYVYQDGSLYVFESGTNKGLVGTYTTGDALKVAIESGQIKY
ncbi:MAG: hypothetical protein ABIQ44_03815, partial [Chloroflexia bacterium]